MTIFRELIELLGIARGRYMWIGLSDRAREGAWVWDDGSTQGRSLWASGQPDNAGSAEDCAHIYDNYDLNDNRCSAQMEALCETDMDT